MESFSPTSCSVDGGEELLITGSHISTQSKVVFMEKGPGEISSLYIYILPAQSHKGDFNRHVYMTDVVSDGRSLWEMDARIVPEKSSGVSRSIIKQRP